VGNKITPKSFGMRNTFILIMAITIAGLLIG
jgi:hypothetical protein